MQEADSHIFDWQPNKDFFDKAARSFQTEARKDSSLRQAITLPARWDFHKQKVYLTRKQKNELQLALSKLDKRQVKLQIKALKEMEKEKLAEAEKHKPKTIIIPQEESRYQEEYKWAFYCREAAKFAEGYLQSLVYQKKI